MFLLKFRSGELVGCGIKFCIQRVPTVMEKTYYRLGCATTDRVTVEINPFPIYKRNKTSNTKVSQNIPYSRWLM